MEKSIEEKNKDAAKFLTSWQQIGNYEYEYNEDGYTGWCRCYQGRMANGIHPCWNDKTGVEKPS